MVFWIVFDFGDFPFFICLVKTGTSGTGTRKNEKFGTPEAEDVKIDYEFIHGKLHTYPFDLNLGKIKGKVGGYSTFDGEIKYTYALKIPRKDLGVAVNNAAGLIQRIAGKNGIDISLGEYINIDVQATGTIKKPIYTALIIQLGKFY